MAMLGAMFVIVFICARRAMKEMAFLDDGAGWAVAFCVALLSILGLVRFFAPSKTVATPAGEAGDTGGLINVVLLPYVALALTLILTLLLLAIGRLLHGRELGRLRYSRLSNQILNSLREYSVVVASSFFLLLFLSC
jgi:hypothetical protein